MKPPSEGLANNIRSGSCLNAPRRRRFFHQQSDRFPRSLRKRATPLQRKAADENPGSLALPNSLRHCHPCMRECSKVLPMCPERSLTRFSERAARWPVVGTRTSTHRFHRTRARHCRVGTAFGLRTLSRACATCLASRLSLGTSPVLSQSGHDRFTPTGGVRRLSTLPAKRGWCGSDHRTVNTDHVPLTKLAHDKKPA